MFIEHFLAFGFFSWVVALFCFRQTMKRVSTWRTIGLFLLGVAPIVGEVAQIWIPSNILFDYGIAHPLFFKFEAHDILYNYAGELFGLAGFKLFKWMAE
jgi:hypothetical protein